MIVGLTGKKGAGKDTAGDYLVREHGFTRLSFADPLKISAAACWPDVTKEDWDVWKSDLDVRVEITRDEQVLASVTGRQFLQRYGTEAHREVFGDAFWIENVEQELDEAPDSWNYVITDARFENEVLALKKFGAVIVSIDRPGVDMADQHASETSVPEDLIDIHIPNDSTIIALQSRLDLLAAGATIPDHA